MSFGSELVFELPTSYETLLSTPSRYSTIGVVPVFNVKVQIRGFTTCLKT